MKTGMSTKQVAEELTVPLGTVKRWVDELGIPVEKDAGGRRFGQSAVDVLRQVQELRIDGRSYQSIRMVLSPFLVEASPDDEAARPEGQPGPVNTEAAAGPSQPEGRPGPVVIESIDAGELVAQAVAQVVEALQRETELAEKYARVAHRVGHLEAQLEAAEAERLRLYDRTRELEGSEETVRALQSQLASMGMTAAADTSERQRLIDELARAGAERERVLAELARAHSGAAQLAPRLWWKLWG
jgi:excisionase family DNA binding protein